MPLSPAQQEIANHPARFRVAVCGRRFGKTHLAVREICKNARLPGKDVYYIAPSYRQAKNIVWRKLKHKLQDLKWAAKINETELSIILKNGSTIALKGADNPDSLRGVSLSFAVFDEFAFMSEETWTEVIRPALADQEGHALFITTPTGKANWAYDLYCLQDEFPEHWKSFTFTTLDGGRVSAAEVERAKADLDERTYRQEFLASFETYGNTVAYAFSREHNLKTLSDPNLAELHIGIDFNNSPITAAIMVKVGNDLYQIDEVYMNDSNTQELADEIKTRYPKSKLIAYPDPAGRQRKTSAGGQTDFTILQNAGFIVKAPHAHNAVRDRINAINARFCTTDGKQHLFIDPKCKHTLESLEKFTYKLGTQQPDKGSGYDHMFDALSYAVDFLFPLKRVTEVKPPQRFGHRLA